MEKEPPRVGVITRRFLVPFLILVGATCGLVAVGFHELVELARRALIDRALPLHGFWRPAAVLAVPTLMAVAISLVIRRIGPSLAGANLARVRRAYEEDPSILDSRSVLGTLILTPLSLGSGAPLGPEGPTVVISSGVSLWLARLGHLPRKMLRGMIPVGTGAGIAAIFNTPMTGVVFAMEEVMGSSSRGVLGGTIIAAVSAAVVERMLLGGKPLLSAPSGAWADIRELAGFLVVGVGAGLVSGAGIRSIVALRRLLRVSIRQDVLRAALGGLLIGCLGLWVPAIFGVGYGTTSAFLHGGGTLHAASSAFAAKTIGLVVALATGILGGTFAPSLFIGASLGATVGHAMQHLFTSMTVDPGAYALIGMGAFFAGLLRCPMASVLIVFEVTGDYGLILPLMLAVAVSLALSRSIAPHSLTELQMFEEGYREHDGNLDPLVSLTVGDVMSRDPVRLVIDMTMLEAARAAAAARHRLYPVVDTTGRLVGVMEASQIDDAALRGAIDETISAAVREAPLVVAEHDDLREALRRMAAGGISRSPVVDPGGILVGFLTSSDVLQVRSRQKAPVDGGSFGDLM
jgi:CIC family chloride channel protein